MACTFGDRCNVLDLLRRQGREQALDQWVTFEFKPRQACSMLMFILPAVTRTGPNGLTAFYALLHLKPHDPT